MGQWDLWSYTHHIDNNNNKGGAEVATADYDEIKDGTHTEKISFEKCQLEADCELTKANYFILTEQPPQEEVDSLCKVQIVVRYDYSLVDQPLPGPYVKDWPTRLA